MARAMQMKASWELSNGLVGDVLEMNVDRKAEELELICRTELKGINKLLNANSVNVITFDIEVIDEIIDALHKAKEFYERGE